jgi:hypothetical protein
MCEKKKKVAKKKCVKKIKNNLHALRLMQMVWSSIYLSCGNSCSCHCWYVVPLYVKFIINSRWDWWSIWWTDWNNWYAKLDKFYFIFFFCDFLDPINENRDLLSVVSESCPLILNYIILWFLVFLKIKIIIYVHWSAS